MSNIYIDFDGTIIDSSFRLYQVYKSIMLESSSPYLSRDEYWQMKRERHSQLAILKKTSSGKILSVFMDKFIRRVESIDFLKFDQLIKGARKTLEYLKKDNRLILVTLRRSKRNLYRELKWLGIFELFDSIYADFKQGIKSSEVTVNSIKKDRGFRKKKSFIIGDTEDTVLAARKLGITGFLVLSGIRSKNFLKRYKQVAIVKDINQIPGLL